MPTFQDLSHALRSLRKRPGFAVAALVTLTVGIGANVTVFTIVNAMLFRPLPFGERSDRVVTVHSTHRLQAEDWGWGESELSHPDLIDLRAAQSFEALAGYLPRNFTLTDADNAERVQGGSVTPDLFRVLGVEPMFGRSFLAEEATAPGLESTVVLTHGLWQRRYGGDPGIVGRGVVINDRARTVVGIMPPNFKFPERDELYMPLRLDEAPRSARNLNVVGAVKPGVSLETAQSELDAIAARLAELYPDTNRGFGLRVLRFRESQIGGDERALSVALMAAVGFVLLIACANLANLFLVRGAARQRDIAVRAAMGAGRWRLLAHVLAESLLLSLAGAALGLLASQWSLDFIRQSFPEELPFWLRFAPDIRVVLFAAGIAIFTTVATGLLPALRAARASVIGDLKDNSRAVSLGPSAQRVQGGLAIVQVALCLALLVGANLMIRSFLALQNADLGFDHRPLLTTRAYLAGDAYDDVNARAAFFARAVAALRELPGVQAAAATTSIPGDDGGSSVRLVIDGEATAEQDLPASSIGVTPEIFDALGVHLLDGRTFTRTEATDPDARVTVVNARLAERLWPGESAVERRIGIRTSADILWFRIIGVAPDVQYRGDRRRHTSIDPELVHALCAQRLADDGVHRACAQLTHAAHAAGARNAPSTQRRPSALRSDADDGAPSIHDLGAALFWSDDGHVCRDCTAAGLHRRLRPAVVCSTAANAGDRRAPGSRGPAQRRHLAVRLAGRRHRCRRAASRPRARHRGSQSAERHALGR